MITFIKHSAQCLAHGKCSINISCYDYSLAMILQGKDRSSQSMDQTNHLRQYYSTELLILVQSISVCLLWRPNMIMEEVPSEVKDTHQRAGGQHVFSLAGC